MLSASQVLDLSSTQNVTLNNFCDVMQTKLSGYGLATKFQWAVDTIPITNEYKAYEDNNTNAWQRFEINFSEAGTLKPFLPCAIHVWVSDVFHDEDDKASIIRIIRRVFLDTLAKFRAYLRQEIVVITLGTQDPNSFCHKVLQLLVRSKLCDGGSVFLLNPDNEYLHLSATTGLKRQIQKKDVIYTVNDQSWVRHSFNTWSVLEEYSEDKSLKENRFGEWVGDSGISARIFIPISFQNKHKEENMRWPKSGVLRLVRLHGGSCPFNQTTNSLKFTWLDHYIFDFISEVMHVVLQGYLNNWAVYSATEKITHGIKAGVDGSLELVRAVNSLMFNRDKRLPRPDNLDTFLNSRFAFDVERLLRNVEYFLLDASDQVEIVTEWTIGSTKKSDRSNPVTRKIFADVLQKAVNLAPQIAVVNSTKMPTFNNLKEYGADQLPPVVGEDGLLLSVFRNLIENAMKYAKEGEPADIEISFSETRGELYIRVADRGIGVPENEKKSLGTEGFRGRRAREVSNRGRGIGLAYCRKILEDFGGKLEYEFVKDGTICVVHLRKA